MRTTAHPVGDELVRIQVIEHVDDLSDFRKWVDDNPVIAVDSETTGLDIYSDDFRLRTVQVSNRHDSWVIPVEKDPMFQVAAEHTIREASRLIVHNAGYDLPVFDRTLGLKLEETYPKTTDTRILASLVDSRGQKDGGIGHSLEALTIEYIDPVVGEEVKGSMSKLAKETGCKKADVFKNIDIDNPDFCLYAAMDPILTWRIAEKLAPLVPKSAVSLIGFEHKVAEVCAVMGRTGFLLDVPYTEALSNHLRGQEDYAAGELYYWWGIDKFGSTEQVADCLEAVGVELKGRTPTGKRKVDKSVLDGLIKDEDHTAHDLAVWVHDAKEARKRRTTWVDGFLGGMDGRNRVHPSINPLAARTGRMSISGIPAQTLPSGDWLIRRCFIPDEGQSLVSVDYQAQELRVLAALSGDSTMKRAFEYGADLHQLTADAAGVSRKVGKMANFLQVYGGGPAALCEGAGISFPDAKRVIDAFQTTYPGVKKFAQAMEKEAAARSCITTPTGRVLPVDPDRGYSAVNYMVQSTSRDVTCRGLLKLYDDGLADYLRLPIHDEVLASVPTKEAAEIAEQIRQGLRMDLGGVCIDTDAEILGESWGAGYVSDEDRSAYERTLY